MNRWRVFRSTEAAPIPVALGTTASFMIFARTTDKIRCRIPAAPRAVLVSCCAMETNTCDSGLLHCLIDQCSVHLSGGRQHDAVYKHPCTHVGCADVGRDGQSLSAVPSPGRRGSCLDWGGSTSRDRPRPGDCAASSGGGLAAGDCTASSGGGLAAGDCTASSGGVRVPRVRVPRLPGPLSLLDTPSPPR